MKPFKQAVEKLTIEYCSDPRQCDLQLVYSDLSEPVFMTKEELLEYNIQPDFNVDEYFKKILDLEDLDDFGNCCAQEFMDKYFDAFHGHSYKNCIDHSAIEFNRGDCTLKISALKLFEEGIALIDNRVVPRDKFNHFNAF
jgi:hypothetical protein